MAYVPHVPERERSADVSGEDGPASLGPFPEPLSVAGLELSLSHASLEVLEAATRALSPEAFGQLFAGATETVEAVLLVTCHRVELVLLLRSSSDLDTWRSALPDGGRGWTVREGVEAVQHLFRVTAGLESLARGESEVRYQVASARARVLSRHRRPVLRTLLDEALGAAATLAPVPEAPPSVASIGVARLRELLPPGASRVLVVGSGTVGREVVASLGPDVEVTVAYHTRPPAWERLEAPGARAIPIDRIREELPFADAVVTAAKFGGRGLRAAEFPRDRPLVVLDLGQPRNVEPAVRSLPNVRLIDLEELHREARSAPVEDGRERAFDERARQVYGRLEPLLEEPWVAVVRRAAEQVRTEELARARRFLGPLSPGQEEAVERLTERLVSRLLAAPTQRLRALPSDPDGERLRRLAWELFAPRSNDS